MATIITNTKINCMPEETSPKMWETIVHGFLTITLPLFLLIWKGSEYMKTIADAKAKKEEDSIRRICESVCETVVNKVMSTPLEQINKSLDQIKSEQKKLDDRIDDIYKHLK